MGFNRTNPLSEVAGHRLLSYQRLVNVRTLAAITLIAYLCQVALFGPIRYFLSIVHLETLWYLPDLLGFMCIGALLLTESARNPRILIFTVVIGLYLVEGYLVSGSVNSVLSTFKALVPLFCGLLLDRALLTRPKLKKALLLIWLVACAGVVYALNEELPWVGMQFEGAGVVQQYKDSQWLPGGDVRIYGFGGDQHSAASSIVTLSILISMGLKRRIFYVVAAVASVAVYLTTSRTNLLCLLVFVALWSVANVRRSATHQPILKWALWLSFFSILVPILVIAFALSFTVETVPSELLSLWVRGTDTWLSPFALIDQMAPLAMLHGFGLGGVGFGLLQSNLAEYALTIDNFILFNYLTFGVPYLVFYLYQSRAMLREHDPYKVMIYVVTMVYGITLRGWSDYLFMILVGYSTSSLFRGKKLIQDAPEKAIAARPKSLWLTS
jgi:hypothetical protein